MLFAGIILGFILLFFTLAFGMGALIIFGVPLVVIFIVIIQTYLKIRDRNLDN